jgi:hypothetical protein
MAGITRPKIRSALMSYICEASSINAAGAYITLVAKDWTAAWAAAAAGNDV